MTAMYKQAFSEYDSEQSAVSYAYIPSKEHNSARKSVKKGTQKSSQRSAQKISDRPSRRMSAQTSDRTSTIRSGTTASRGNSPSLRSDRARSAQTTSSRSHSSNKARVHTQKRGDAISQPHKTVHSETKQSFRKSSIDTRRSATIDRALQKRKKRLAQMERGNLPSGKLTTFPDNLRGTEQDAPHSSRLRTRVRYLHTPQRTIVGRLIAKPMDKVSKHVHFFVVLAGMFIAGLMLTLWLSSQSAMSAYEQERLSNRNAILNNYVNELTKELAEGNSTPVLSQKATEMGMVPASDINVLQHKGRSWTVFGAEKNIQTPHSIPSYDKKVPTPHAYIPRPRPMAPILSSLPPVNDNKIAPPVINSTPPSQVTAVPNPVTPVNPVPAPAAPITTNPPGLTFGTDNQKPEMPILPGDPDVHNAPIQPLPLQSSLPGGVPVSPVYSPAAQAQFSPTAPVVPRPVWKAPTGN